MTVRHISLPLGCPPKQPNNSAHAKIKSVNVHRARRMWGAYLLCCVYKIMAAAALDIVWLFAGLLIWLTILFQGTCRGKGTFIPRQVQERWRKIMSSLLTHKGRTKLVCSGHGVSSGSLVPHLFSRQYLAVQFRQTSDSRFPLSSASELEGE